MLVTDPKIYARSHVTLRDWWRSELDGAAQIHKRYAAYPRTEAFLVRSTQSRRLDKLHGARWVAIGDAATTFDPLSSQGIAKAVEQGTAVASAISQSLNGNVSALAEYADDVCARYAAYAAERAGYYRLEQRWSDSEFWRSRQQLAA